MRVTRHDSCWVSPFGNPRIHARLTAPRGISQPPTSFIGSRCQGIHHAPLDTYKHYKNQRKITHFNEYATTRATHPFRCSQPLSNSQTPHPTTKMEGQLPYTNRVLSQDPTACRPPDHPPPPHRHGGGSAMSWVRGLSTTFPPMSAAPRAFGGDCGHRPYRPYYGRPGLGDAP